jgi:hypothetical protein
MSSGRSTTSHRVATALRERRSPAPSSSDPSDSAPAPASDPAPAPAPEEQQQDNPFAPPPENAPKQPWQPRRPDGDGDAGSGQGQGQGQGGPAWGGGRWGDRQPGRQDGGLGQRPDGGPDAPGTGGGPRFDPTDPAQRRARYALLSGMWGLFCAAFLGWTSIALLLAALAVYWGISSLRMKPEERAKARAATAAALSGGRPTPPPPAGGQEDEKPQRTAAVSGIVTGGIAMALVAATFTAHIVYKDYYTCTRDALTSASRDSCADLLPAPLRTVLSESS